MTTHPRPTPGRRLRRLALIAGLAVGLAAPSVRAVLIDPEDEIPADLRYALSFLSPEEAQAWYDAVAEANLGQEPDDAPRQPTPKPPDASVAKPAEPAPGAALDLPQRDARGRVVKPDEPTVLAFKNVTVEQVVPFIVEATGKVVLPAPDVMGLRITILNDQKIPRAKALDMVFLALQQNGIAVIEAPDIIYLRSISEIDRVYVPVVGPDESVRTLPAGIIVQKVFALHYSSASNIAEMFKQWLPNFAKMTFDPDSNQVVITADVGTLQRMEQTLETLDRPPSAALSTETFHLHNADADQIAQNIRDLYAQNNNQQRNGGGNNPFQNFFRGGGNQPGGARPGGAAAPSGPQRTPDAATSANLRVTSNAQQNAVTVLAEKQVLEQVRRQIETEWDLPLGPDQSIPKAYQLKNSDPIKVRDSLINLFGSAGSTRAGQPNNANQSTANRLYGQFTFEAIPEAGKLLVVAKSRANLEVIDQFIAELDQPLTAGLPQIIELKHADAEQLAEQLNALLSREGTLAQVTKSENGLSTAQAGQSPFAQTQTNTTANQQQQAANSIWNMWWSRAQPPTTTAGSGNLVGKIRIVPVWRQNSLMVLAPPEYQGSLVQVIQQLDNPGRQVLLSAVIAEITVEDATALGLRWSNTAITPTKQDNAISFGPSAAGTQAGGTVTGTKNNLIPSLFDTSVLNLGVNINALIQALNEKTAISILSEPRIFTSDNQQAEFFAGQDVPFITESQPNTQGNLVQSFDYRAVGINLRVRPRITVQKEVDININLQLASIEPGQTLFGGFIVDRKETTTHLVVKDGQTVVLSGILRTEDNDVHRKVPFLGDIPLVGPLFNSIERTKTKTELIAFVTPYVVDNVDQTRNVDQADHERLQEVQKLLAPIANIDRPKNVGNQPAGPQRVPGEPGTVPPPGPSPDHTPVNGKP